jgi:hypothetical protein
MLNQDDRISISKKIAQIPLDNKQLDANMQILDQDIQKKIAEDNANKSLIAPKDVLINHYQLEQARWDGNQRRVLIEQDYLDSAKRTVPNGLFPNNPQAPIPSLPDGVYKGYIPFAGSYAVGKNYNESYTVVRKEQDIINEIQDKITALNAFSEIQRTTGQTCVSETTTPVGGGSPTTTSTIENDPVIQGLASDIVTLVGELVAFLNATKSIMLANPDTNTSRLMQSNAAANKINIAVVNLSAWLDYPTFSTGHGQTTCPDFNSYNPYLLPQSKFRNDSRDILTGLLTLRTSDISSRSAEVLGYLGGVTQDPQSGDVSSYLGFYGERFRIISMRLHIMSGSLSKLQGSQMGVDAQVQAKAANDNALAVYESLMVCKRFVSPAGGHSKIAIENTTGLLIGQTCYVVAENQQELTGSIVSINGNVVELSFNVPKKYRETDLARIYVLL